MTQVTRGGRVQVVGRSVIGHKASQVSRRSVVIVSRRSRRGRGSGARVYADRLTNGLRGSRIRKSVVERSQVTLISWPIIHFSFMLGIHRTATYSGTIYELKNSGFLGLMSSR